MKFEFRCDHCNRLLRVAVVHVGALTACPACHSKLEVPESAPTSIEEAAPLVWMPQTASLPRILKDTWTLYVENLWMLLAVALIDLCLWIVGIVLVFIPAVGTFAVIFKALGLNQAWAVVGMCLVLILGLMSLVNVMICTQTKFFLKVARGEPIRILEAFQIHWNKQAVSPLPTIFGVITLTGLMLCAVPGMFVYLRYWPYIWVWADRQTDNHDALAFPLASQLSNRNLRSSVAITAIGIGLSLVGFKVFGRSLNGLLKAVSYLHMSGQEVTGLAHREKEPVVTFEGVDPA